MNMVSILLFLYLCMFVFCVVVKNLVVLKFCFILYLSFFSVMSVDCCWYCFFVVVLLCDDDDVFFCCFVFMKYMNVFF